MAFKININGEENTVDVAPDTPLLWVIRDNLRLTGTKFGCGIAQCGACTVWLDGAPARSCVTPIESVGATKVTTIEGLTGREAEAIRNAWVEIDVPQCGYCQSGQVMAATALLSTKPDPSDKDIDEAMTGNICRCATYMRIRQAIKNASKSLKG